MDLYNTFLEDKNIKMNTNQLFTYLYNEHNGISLSESKKIIYNNMLKWAKHNNLKNLNLVDIASYDIQSKIYFLNNEFIKSFKKYNVGFNPFYEKMLITKDNKPTFVGHNDLLATDYHNIDVFNDSNKQIIKKLPNKKNILNNTYSSSISKRNYDKDYEGFKYYSETNEFKNLIYKPKFMDELYKKL